MALRVHVVYAGRGDAFVLEDGKQLWAIDGGPLGRSPRSRGGGPYFAYLAQALKKVAAEQGQPANTLALDGAVISHAHEDHYGGLLRLFREQLSTVYATAPTPARPLVFNGPLVTQPLDDLSQAGQREVLWMFKQYAFAAAAPPAPEALGPFRFGSADEFPRTVYGRAPAPSQQLGRIWTVDESADNLASVLMFHEAGRMLFTGDSVGAKILPFIGKVAQGRPLAVFKVPHHGSFRNSQRTGDRAKVPARAWHEYALLCVLLDPTEWEDFGVPGPLRVEGPMAVARDELAKLCKERGLDPRTLGAELKAAVTANFTAAAAGAPIDWTFAKGPTEELWTSLVKSLEPLVQMGAGDSTRKRPRGEELPKGVRRSWYWALLTPALLTEPYLSELAWTELKAFYSGFPAYNYAISADGSHGHPAAETIAAIAATRTAANPTARVFVTDASSVDLDRIGYLVGLGWRDKIDLRALTSGNEIVLDLSNADNAKPSNPATPPFGTQLPIDPLQTTTSVAALAEPTRKQLHRDLQNSPGARILPRTIIEESYLLKVPGASLYLNLDGIGNPSVVASQKAFQVEEAWQLQPPQPEVTIVRLRGATTAPGATRLVKLIDRGGGHWALQLVPENDYVSTDAAQGYRTQDLNDPKLAVFEFSETGAVGEQQPAGAAEPGSSLRAFLQAAGLPGDGPLAGRAALAALVGPGSAAAVEAGVDLPVLKRIFGWEADLDASTVTWSSDGEGLLVTEATLAVAVGSPSTFTIEGVTETIVSTSITVAQGGPLAVTVALRTADKTTIEDVVTIDSPSRGRLLAEYLSAIGVEPAKQPEVTVAGLLARMLGGQSRVEDLLMSAPSFVAAAGLGTVTLDVAASEAETFASPIGGIDVRAAKLVTKQPSVKATVAGVSLTLENATLTVEDAMLPSARVVLGADATIAPGPQSQPVALRAEMVLSDERPELSLSLVGGGSLQQVVALLPGTPALGNLEVPVAAKTLGSLSLSSLGLGLRQPVEDADAYVVSSVFGAIEFSGWSAILPAGFPAPASSSVRVRVFEPEDAAQRRVGFAAEASFALSGGRTLAAEVSAWPMSGSGATGAAAGGVAKSVALWADPQQAPVTLADALSTFGLPNVGGALPALGALLDGVALEAAEIELEDAEGGGTQVSAFELGFWISRPWTPLSGFSLAGGRLDLRYDGREWSGEVGATMLLGDTHVVEAGYVVPTATRPGAFTFAAVTPLSLAEAAGLLGFGSLAGLPFGSLLEKVSVSEVALGLAPSSATVPTVDAWSLGLLLDTIEIGPLTVDGVAVDLGRAVVDGKTETSLWLEAEFGGGSAILGVEWDSSSGKLAGALRMVKPQTVEELLAELFGSGAPVNVLLPLVGQFAVLGAEVEFDTAGQQLKAFRLELDTSRSLTLGPATVSSLAIAYAAADGPGGTATYVLSGKVTGDQLTADIEIDCQAASGSSTVTASVKSAGSGSEALTLGGLLSIFGLGSPTVPHLRDAPEFLALEIAEVSAELSYAGGLGLEGLTAKVRSTSSIPLVPTTPPIELEKLGLDVTYEKAASPTLTGVIFGTLTVPTSPQVILDLEYAVGKDGAGVFEGNLALTDPPDFKALLAQGPYDPGEGGGVPSDIRPGEPIPMAEMAVRVEMATAAKPTSVAVSGYARPTEWRWQSLGVDFAIEELGGKVVVVAPQAEDGTPHYDCSLFGKLSFDGFEGKATLSFGAARNTVLTASAAQAKAVQLPEVAGKLSSSGDTWAGVVPAGTAPLGFGEGSSAYAYLDLTAKAFALYGSLAGFGTGALISHVAGGVRSYAFLAGLSSSFRFENLWPQMQTIDDYVAVRSANLAILDYDGTVDELKSDIGAVARAAAEQGVSLQLPFADLDWLGEVGTGPPQLPKGGAFFADLALSAEGELSKNLDLIAAEPTAATIALYALVDHAEPQKSVYRGRVSDLKLIGGALTLAGAVIYRPADAAEQLEVSGSLTLVLAGSEAGHRFDGRLTLGTEKATFEVTAGGDPISIEDPFGGMFGITIAEAALAAEFEFAESGTTSAIVVSGKVALKAAAGLPSLAAAIAFREGRPALAVVSLPGTVSVDKLLAGIGVPWPSGYEVLSFEKGSIYYAPAAVTIGGVDYRPGYHMATTARVLGHPVGIDVEVHEDGIVVGAVIEEGLDFYFLQLTGYTDHEQEYKGPTLAIDTRDPVKFEIGAGVSLFKTPIASTTIAYQPSLEEWTGSVTPPSSLPVLGGRAIGFSYSEEKGFRLTDLELLSELLEWAELAEQLIEASKGTPCGELVDLAWDSVVTTKANVKFTSGEPTAAALPISVGGTFDILVAGQKVVTVPLPTLTGTIPKPAAFELSRLPEWLATLLGENLAAMARSLFEDKDKDKLAAFIGALAGLTAARKGLEALICKGVKTPNVGEAVETSVETGVESAEALAGDAAAGAGSALSAESLAGAAAGAAAAAAAVGLLVALVEELVDLIDSALGWLGLSDKKEKAEAEQARAEAKLAEARARMAEVLTMAGAPTAAFAPGSAERVQVSWTDADRPSKSGFDYEGYVGVRYQAQVSTSPDFEPGTVSAPVEGGGSPIAVSLPALASSNYAYAQVRAVYRYKKGQEWEGPWMPVPAGEAPFHLVPLPAPATVSQALVDDGDTIAVTVAAVAEATGYLVTLVDPANPSVALLSRRVPAPPAGPAAASLDVRELPNTVPTGASLVAVAVAEGDPKLHSPSPPAGSASLATSAPPSAPAASVESNGIHVTWAAVAGASRYEVRVVGADGVPLAPQPAVLSRDPDGTGLVLGVEGIADGATVGVELRTPDTTRVALWSSPATEVKVPVLPAPGNCAAFFEAPEQILLHWDEDARASGWEVEATDAAGGQLSPQPAVAAEATGATVKGSAIAVGGSYRVRARALAPGAASLWSEWLPVTAAAVAAPTGVGLAFSGAIAEASWQAVASAGTYRVALLVLPAGTVVARQSTAETGARFEVGPPIGPEAQCEVTVRAQVETSIGPAASASAVAPSLLELVEAGRAHGEDAEGAAAAALAYQPALGYAELLVTLAAAGYPADEARSATEARFPGVPLDPLVAALAAPAKLAPLLRQAGVAVVVTVRLAAKLYPGKPVELAIQLRFAGLSQGDVAMALPSAYASVSPAAAGAIAAAVYAEPWALGAQLHAGAVEAAAVVPDLLDAYPELPLVRTMASLNAYYEVPDESKPVGAALVAKYGAEDFGVALGILLVRSGKPIARKLHEEGVARGEAVDYVAAAYPRLSAAEVQQAIEAAYGPPGR